MRKRFVCPFWRDISDEKFNLLFTKTSRTRADMDEPMFYYLHTPVLVKDENRVEWKENKILDLFDVKEPRKVVTIIHGNTGTGKSELCLYLYFELKKIGREVLLIEKNASLMDILSRDIPAFFKQLTGKDFPKKEKSDRLNRILREAPKSVARMASSAVVIRLVESRGISEDNLSEFGELLRELMFKNLVILTQKGEAPTDMTFVKTEELRSSQFRGISEFAPGETLEQQATELNRLLWEAIRKHYEVPTLDHAIETLCKEVGGFRPVIVFEDFSIVGLDFEQLTKFMEGDNPEYVVDFIVAGVQDKVPKRVGTRVERFRYFSTTTTEQPQVLFLNEETCVDFIEKYLAYPKVTTNTASKQTDLINNTICKKCGKCPPEHRRVTPFNTIFLERIFDGVSKENRTPRTYVDTIRQMVDEYRKDGVIPSDSNVISSLSAPPDSVNYEEITDPTIQRLANWYGQVQADTIVVDRKTAELFEIETSEFEVGDTLSFPLFKAISTLPIVISPLKNQGETELVDLKKILSQWSLWKENPNSDKAQEFRIYFNDGLKKMIEIATGRYCSKATSKLCLKVGQNEYPFHMQGIIRSTEQSVEIYPEMFSQGGATHLMYLGFLTKQRGGSGTSKHEVQKTVAQTLESNSYAVGRIVYQFRNQIEQILKKEIWSQHYTSYRDLYQTVLACIKILMAFDDPLREPTNNQIVKWLLSEEDNISYNTPNNLGKWLQEELDRILTSTRNIKEISRELFGLTAKSFNAEEIGKVASSISNPMTTAKGIKRCNAKRNIIFKDYPIRDILEPFSQIIDIKKAVWRTLEENEDNNNILDETRHIPPLLTNLQPKRLKKQLKRIKNIDQVDDDLKATLTTISNLTRKTIEAYQRKIKRLFILSENQDSDNYKDLCFTLAVEKLSKDPILSAFINARKKLRVQRIQIEEEPVRLLFSILQEI